MGYLLESHAVELLKKVHMELSPLMFFFKKITCWIYQYNGIYIFLSFLSFSFGFWLLRAYTIHRTCPSYALEKRTLTSNGYLVHIWEGVHKFRGNVNVEIVHTCIRTFIHPNIHDPKRNKNVFIPSVANKNSTYEKRFLTGFFFLSFNKKKKKKLQHLNGRTFCCSLLVNKTLFL